MARVDALTALAAAEAAAATTDTGAGAGTATTTGGGAAAGSSARSGGARGTDGSAHGTGGSAHGDGRLLAEEARQTAPPPPLDAHSRVESINGQGHTLDTLDAHFLAERQAAFSGAFAAALGEKCAELAAAARHRDAYRDQARELLAHVEERDAAVACYE
jgi:hypothetical protein